MFILLCLMMAPYPTTTKDQLCRTLFIIMFGLIIILRSSSQTLVKANWYHYWRHSFLGWSGLRAHFDKTHHSMYIQSLHKINIHVKWQNFNSSVQVYIEGFIYKLGWDKCPHPIITSCCTKSGSLWLRGIELSQTEGDRCPRESYLPKLVLPIGRGHP